MNGPKLVDRNDRSFMGRAVIWSGAAAVLIGVAYWLAGLWAVSYLRTQLDAAATQGSALVQDDPEPDISVDLARRRVAITGLRLIRDAAHAPGALLLTGRVDTLELDGISLSALLFERRLVIGSIRLSTTGISMNVLADSLRRTQGQDVGDDGTPWSVEVGALELHLRSSMFISALGDSVRAMGDGIRAKAVQYRYGADGTAAPAVHQVEQMKISADSLVAQMANGYACSITHGTFDQKQRSIVLNGSVVSPRGGLEKYSAGLRYETDVIEARIDTLLVSGFDLNHSLRSGAVTASRVRVAAGNVEVLRDKTLPDGTSVEVPLPGALIRRLPTGHGVDTIVIAEMDVRYRERAVLSRGYAEVPFKGIHATVLGSRHIPYDSSEFVINAHCTAFNQVPVSMVLRSVVQDTTDRFLLDAHIGTMPFALLNMVIGPLLDVRALEGRIDSVDLHMEADAYRANGLVQLAYHELKLSTGGAKSRQVMDQLGTLLLNTLVKKDNRNSGGPRQGHFAFDRRRDRAIFNYMWSGLREGTKQILLPQSLTP